MGGVQKLQNVIKPSTFLFILLKKNDLNINFGIYKALLYSRATVSYMQQNLPLSNAALILSTETLNSFHLK